MPRNYDLVVIGTGPASSPVAAACHDRYHMAVVDELPPGGTCALRGCNPKKVLVHASELCDWLLRARGTLVDSAPDAGIDWSQLIQFEERFTAPISSQLEESHARKGIDVVLGSATFLSPHEIQVGGNVLTAGKVVVATGAGPRPLPDVGGNELLSTSTDLLGWPERPDEVLFVGGGFIAFEFAPVLALAGARVTIVHRDQRPLAEFDPDLVKRLLERYRELGIDIVLDAEVTGLERLAGGRLQVTAQNGAGGKSWEVDRAVHTAGRVPLLDGLDLEAAGVDYGPEGIQVDEYLRSRSQPHVLAAGDAADTGQPRLSPVAGEEGAVLAHNLLNGFERRLEPAPVPSVAFTVPSLSRLGLLEEEASEQGIAFEVREGEHSRWNSVRKVSEPCAAYKILVSKDDDTILGAHLLGPRTEELINVLALAVRSGLTARQVKSVPFAFPTFSSDLRAML